MASLGHIAVGMAAARIDRHTPAPRWSSMAWWSALSLLPDVDVVGFALGVNYGDPWGHRGATHSFTFSIALGLAVGLAARWFKRPALRLAGARSGQAARTGLIATIVLASHATLDTMTDGGLGCALLWPFDLTRYFAPWRPIPVAPIGLAFFSPYGGIIALTELALFSPLLIFALRSRSIETKRHTLPIALFLGFWVVSVWLISSDNRARDGVVGLLLREDTAYASGFSEEAFRTITPGESDKEVRRLLGPPLREGRFYASRNQPFQSAIETSVLSLPHECLSVRFEAGVVVTALDLDACRKIGIEPGMSAIDVDRLLGSPSESCWQYSWSPGDAYFRLRMVCFLNGGVTTVIREWQR
jgi:inner membrane protein